MLQILWLRLRMIQLPQIAPKKLHDGQRGQGCCFSAKNSPSHMHRLETLRVGQFDFSFTETTLRSDGEQHVLSLAAFLEQLAYRLFALVFPEDQFECFRPGLAHELFKATQRAHFWDAAPAALFRCAYGNFPPTL